MEFWKKPMGGKLIVDSKTPEECIPYAPIQPTSVVVHGTDGSRRLR